MDKVSRIIEHQERQRTPMEVVEFLRDEIEKGTITHVVAIFRDERYCGYAPGSADRSFSKSQILWDVEQWKKEYLNE